MSRIQWFPNLAKDQTADLTFPGTTRDSDLVRLGQGLGIQFFSASFWVIPTASSAWGSVQTRGSHKLPFLPLLAFPPCATAPAELTHQGSQGSQGQHPLLRTPSDLDLVCFRLLCYAIWRAVFSSSQALNSILIIFLEGEIP